MNLLSMLPISGLVDMLGNMIDEQKINAIAELIDKTKLSEGEKQAVVMVHSKEGKTCINLIAINHEDKPVRICELTANGNVYNQIDASNLMEFIKDLMKQKQTEDKKC